MQNSRLTDHKFIRGKFVTPWNSALASTLSENSWFLSRMPNFLWLGLILDFYGRDAGIQKFMAISPILAQKGIYHPSFANIFALKNDVQNSLFAAILSLIDKKALSPLTAIFRGTQFPSFFKNFFISNSTIEDRISKVSTAISKLADHQSNFATDVRYLVVYHHLRSGKFFALPNQLQLLAAYPSLNHADEIMKMIRSSIRATEIAMGMSTDNTQYLKHFWDEVSKMCDCKLFGTKYDEEFPQDDSARFIAKVKQILEFYNMALAAAFPLDNKMLVLLGISTISYKRVVELINHNLYNTVTGRNIVRSLIENFIMTKYLLANESKHKDIWSEFQYYGIGQYKLIQKRFEENVQLLIGEFIPYQYIRELVNEYKDEEYIDMDTNYFGNANIREKAESTGEKRWYNCYDYSSSYEHSLWGAIRESSLLKCGTASHQFHCVPDLDCSITLKSVWPDCRKLMEQQLALLESVYGLPEQLALYM